jgi:hypothetical protein
VKRYLSLTEEEQSERRRGDLALLAILEEHGEALDDEQSTRAESVAAYMRRSERHVLSDAQRAMVLAFCRISKPDFEDDVTDDKPRKSAAEIPRGAPVVTPDVLRRLPLKPPGWRGGAA